MNIGAPFMRWTAPVRCIVACLALAGAVEWFAWMVLAGADYRIADRVREVTEQVQRDDGALQQELQHRNAKSSSQAAGRSNSDFLNQINDAIASTGIRVTRLAPQAKDEHLIDGEFVGGFGNLVRFLTDVEARGGIVRSLRFGRVRDNRGGAALDELFLTIENRSGAGLRGKHVDLTRARAADPSLRDILAASNGFVTDTGDLSSRYRLSAITRHQSGAVATINDFDFSVGDALDDTIVSEIHDDHVTLKSDRDDRRLLLYFRGRDH